MNTWQQQLLTKIELCYQMAESQLQRRFPRPEVNFKLRGKSAGVAHLSLNKIRFNLQMLQENQQVFIDQVVPHEICHLLCHQLYGKVKPHGLEWQQLMRDLYQQEPRTTHSFNVQAKPQPRFNYQCQCGVVALSIRRHNKVVRNQANYRCKRCMQVLKQVA